jgi:hypothetical protein
MKSVQLFAAMTLLSGWTAATDFTSYEIPGDPGAAAWAQQFTQDFVYNRITLGPTLFPIEYLAISDSFLNDGAWAHRDPAPHVFTRNMLLDKKMDAEGYVFSQQHLSSSLDDGWPFPVWPQIPGSHEGISGGWHFYENPEGWEIVINHVRKNRKAFPHNTGIPATEVWELQDLRSNGLDPLTRSWNLEVTGPSPMLISPEETTLDAFNCPFVQIRWTFTGELPEGQTPYMEWQRTGDKDWSETRRMYFTPDRTTLSGGTGMYHSILRLYRHPEWDGTIQRFRFRMPAGLQGNAFNVRSIFTAWDTRHLVNNAIYIKAVWEHVRWTHDLDLLRQLLPNLRQAMTYMMVNGNGLKLKRIRCTWPGHDGRPGYTVHGDGRKDWHIGHGKGGNYWDLLPLGWDDMYTTIHYYAALQIMAQIEQLVATHPSWGMPRTLHPLKPEDLRAHAAEVKSHVNDYFWNEEAGRFIGTIDADGIPRDYGFTFINLEAVYYGLADDTRAEAILKWIDGQRIVPGDTSQGEDLYAYRLAPRATTKRNIEWYGFFWQSPEILPFGGQVQDGGAVLGFSFYDILSRIRVLGPENAWNRFMAIREWDEEVRAYGGYRKYYADGKGGTTLQGGGTAGGIGIDFEFTESSMLAAVIPYGFLGLDPDGEALEIDPRLPPQCPEMTIRNLKYRGVLLDIAATESKVTVTLHEVPTSPIRIRYAGAIHSLNQPGTLTLSSK